MVVDDGTPRTNTQTMEKIAKEKRKNSVKIVPGGSTGAAGGSTGVAVVPVAGGSTGWCQNYWTTRIAIWAEILPENLRIRGEIGNFKAGEHQGG